MASAEHCSPENLKHWSPTNKLRWRAGGSVTGGKHLKEWVRTHTTQRRRRQRRRSLSKEVSAETEVLLVFNSPRVPARGASSLFVPKKNESHFFFLFLGPREAALYTNSPVMKVG